MDVDALLLHQDFVRSLSRAIARDPDHAGDLEQETWLAALRQNEVSSWRAWIRRTLLHAAGQEHRRESRRARREAVLRPEPSSPDAVEILQKEEHRRAVVHALLRLPEPSRTVLLMRYYEGSTPPEISERLGVPLETVRTRLRRGLARLRTEFPSEDPSPGKRATGFLVLMRSLWSPPRLVGVVTAIGLVGVILRGVLLGGASLGESSPSSRKTEGLATGLPEASTAVRGLLPEAQRQDLQRADGGSSLAGRIVDATGSPVPHAWVDALPLTEVAAGRTPWTLTETVPDRGVRADELGRFELRLPHSAGWCAVAVVAPGFGPTVLHDVPVGSEVQVALGEGRDLGGRVSTARGEVVAEARLRWWTVEGGATVQRSARSDSEGRYRMRDLPRRRGPWWARVDAEGHPPLLVSGDGSGRGPGAADHGLTQNFVLAEPCELLGRVLDADTGLPLADAHVVAWAEGDHSTQRQEAGHVVIDPARVQLLAQETTSGSGGFALRRLPTSGFHRLAHHSRKNRQTFGTVAIWKLGQVPVVEELALLAAEESRAIEFRSWPAASLRGRLVDDEGAGLAGVEVRIEGAPGPAAPLADLAALEGWPRSIATSGADGEFVIEAVATHRAQPTTVSVELSRHQASLGAREVALRAGEHRDLGTWTVDDRHAATWSAKVQVVDDQGAPVPGAWIVGGVDPDLNSFPQVTDEDGRALIESLYDPRRELRIRVRAPGYATTISDPFALTTEGSAPVVWLQRGRQLRGRVVDAEGRPAAGVHVVAFDGRVEREHLYPDSWDRHRNPIEHRHGAQSTDAQGRFLLRCLPSGSLTLHVSHGRRECFVRIEDPDSEDQVLVTLPPARPRPSELRVPVVDEVQGLPLANLQGFLAPPGGPPPGPLEARGRARAIAPGVLGFEAEAGTRWDLHLTAEGHVAVVVADLEFGEEPFELDPIRMVSSPWIRGCIADWPPTGLRAGSSLGFRHEASGTRLPAEVLHNGQFALRSVGPGSYRLLFRGTLDRATGPAPALATPSRVELGSEDAWIQPRIEAGGTLEARVPSPEGNPREYRSAPPGHRLSIRGIEGELVELTALTFNVTMVSELRPGRYELMYTDDQGNEQRRTALIEIGRTTSVEFSPPPR